MIKRPLFLIFLISFTTIVSSEVVFETDAFLKGPTKVFDACTDKNFTCAFPLIGRYNSSDLIAIWAFNTGCKAPPYTLTATRRLINTTTLQAVENDTFISVNITCNSNPWYTYTFNNYIGIACTTPDASSPNISNIVVYSFPSTIQSPSEIKAAKITSNTQADIEYKVLQLAYYDGYFYVTYTLANTDPPLDLYLQGVSVTNSNQKRYHTPPTLQSDDTSGISKSVCAKLLHNDTVVCAWREDTQARVVYATVNPSTSVVSTEVVIANDVGSYKFYPVKIIVSESHYAILMKQVSNGATEKFSIHISTSQETALLPFTLEAGYNDANLTAAGAYFDGFFTIIRSREGSNGYALHTQESLQLYDSSGATNGNEIVLLEDGRIFQGLVLDDQSYWVLCLDTMAGNWERGYLGKVFDRISNSGNNLHLVYLLGSLLVFLTFIL